MILSHETLAIIWFILVNTLWVGFILLESLTSGVGMIFNTAKNEAEGKLLQLTVGPYWDGSQVWLVAAGGGTFAAFPLVYAETFSYLYVPLYLLLVSLLSRAVSLELIYKDDSPTWRKVMKYTWIISSYLVALILGLRFTNMFIGSNLDANGLDFSALNFLGLFNRIGILGGLYFILFYVISGIGWVYIKAKGDIATRNVKNMFIPSVLNAGLITLLMMAFNHKTYLFFNFQEYLWLWILPSLAIISAFITAFFAYKKDAVKTFTFNLLTMFLYLVTGFVGMFPYMITSKIDREFGVTITEASASHLTLTIMFYVAVLFVPLVIGYQAWKFIFFRKKIGVEDFN